MQTTDVRGEVNASQLMGHVKKIAQWVRLSGHPDEAKAFDYIEAKLTEWGVSVQRQTHPAYISLPVKAKLVLSHRGQEREVGCITHSMGVTTAEDGVSGRVVDVGGGTDEEYERAGFVTGCIALVSRLAAPEKVFIAAKHQAAGAIFINGPELHEMIVSPVWGSPSSATVGLLPNLPIVSIVGTDGNEIRRQLTDGVTATVFTEVLTEWRPIPLLIADIAGAVYPKELVMLGGHVDSWHYGAMDNASANAVQLEVLRVFQEHRAELTRSLRVAFWSGHSHGRYAGSTWYVDNNFVELDERLVAHLYVDSVGGKGATVLSEAWAMSETKHVAARTLKQETGDVFNGGRFARGGDQSFYGVGVSGLFMCLSEQPPAEADEDAVSVSQLLGGNGKTGGLGSWWHAVDDTPDKLDPDYLLRDARIYLATLSEFLTAGKLPLDFRPTIAELLGHLEHWQSQAGDRFSLQTAIAACTELGGAVAAFYRKSENGEVPEAEFNKTVVGLSRRLVPLNYSTGNRFEHDLAMNYPPIPALAPISDLLQQNPGSNAELHTLVLLQRRLNYVTQTFLDTIRFLGA